MANIDVTAKKGANEVTVQFDFGDNLASMTEKFGEDIVFGNARQSMKITLQALLRRGIEAGKDAATIATEAAAWKPGQISQRSSDPVAAITAKWASLDENARKELLRKLREMA